MSLVAKTKNVLSRVQALDSRVQVGANISSQANFIVRNQVSGKTVTFFSNIQVIQELIRQPGA